MKNLDQPSLGQISGRLHATSNIAILYSSSLQTYPSSLSRRSPRLCSLTRALVVTVGATDIHTTPGYFVQADRAVGKDSVRGPLYSD